LGLDRESYEVRIRIGPEPVKKMPAFIAHLPCGQRISAFAGKSLNPPRLGATKIAK
jgi:hypothetical protein